MDSVLQRRIRILLQRPKQTDRCQGIEQKALMLEIYIRRWVAGRGKTILALPELFCYLSWLLLTATLFRDLSRLPIWSLEAAF